MTSSGYWKILTAVMLSKYTQSTLIPLPTTGKFKPQPWSQPTDALSDNINLTVPDMHQAK